MLVKMVWVNSGCGLTHARVTVRWPTSLYELYFTLNRKENVWTRTSQRVEMGKVINNHTRARRLTVLRGQTTIKCRSQHTFFFARRLGPVRYLILNSCCPTMFFPKELACWGCNGFKRFGHVTKCSLQYLTASPTVIPTVSHSAW